MTRIAFIGLGIMGAPMAGHLVTAGHHVVGYNRSQSAVEAFVALGGRGASSIAEAVTEAEVVITMVPDSSDVQDVTVGVDGFYSRVPSGTLHIDCSSIRPDIAQSVAAAGAEAGIAVIDAPVSGGQGGAEQATLSIMVGGAADDVARAGPLLDVMGKTIVHVGGSGSGQTVKAANQLLVAGTIELVAEAIVFLEAHHVDTDAAVKVLAGGLAGNAILDRKVAGMLARNFTPGFRVDLHHKDMGIVTAAARAAGVALPLGDHVAGLIGSLRAEGHGQLDHSALLLLVQQLSGRAAPDKKGLNS